VNRCLGLLIALVSTLILALPAAIGAGRPYDRATVHVRHQAIHSPAHKGAKRSCTRRHKAHKRRKRASSCRAHKRAVRHAHKRAPHNAHRRALRHAHKRVVRHAPRPGRPATASRDCPGANLTPRADNIESVVTATLCLVNDERARFGAPALIEDARLASAAAGHSHDMDAHHYFEHVSPSGQTVLMRIRASGFIPGGRVGFTLGENIAWGTLWLGTPRAIVKAWMGSPGHRANILNRSYHYSGIGIDSDLPRSMSGGQAGGMYTQDFGTILG
jgi:uncharacterized protein YkwD